MAGVRVGAAVCQSRVGRCMDGAGGREEITKKGGERGSGGKDKTAETLKKYLTIN